MRLIDADALLEEFVGINDGWLKPPKGWRWYEDSVRNAPTVNGWISVKERLPETRLVEDGGDSWKASGDVLCYGAGEIRIGYYEDDLDGRTWWNDREHGEGIPVTHWMELPAPPEV